MKIFLTIIFSSLFLVSISQELIEFKNEDYGFELIEFKILSDNSFHLNMTIPYLKGEWEGGGIYEEKKYNYTGKWNFENDEFICEFDSINLRLDTIFIMDEKKNIGAKIIDKNKIEFSNQTDTIYILNLPIIKI